MGELVTRFSFDDLEEEDHIEQWLDTMAEIEEEDDEMEEAQRMVVDVAQGQMIGRPRFMTLFSLTTRAHHDITRAPRLCCAVPRVCSVRETPQLSYFVRAERTPF